MNPSPAKQAPQQDDYKEGPSQGLEHHPAHADTSLAAAGGRNCCGAICGIAGLSEVDGVCRLIS